MVRLFNYNYTEKLYHLYFNNLLWNLSIKISGAKHEHFVKESWIMLSSSVFY